MDSNQRRPINEFTLATPANLTTGYGNAFHARIAALHTMGHVSEFALKDLASYLHAVCGETNLLARKRGAWRAAAREWRRKFRHR